MTESAAAPTPEVKPADAPAATPTPEPVSQPDAVDDDAKIWAELQAAEEGKPVESPTEKKIEQQRQDDKFAGDPENAIDQPVAPPAAAVSAQTPPAAGSPTPAPTPDIWADAPPKLKAEYDALKKVIGNADATDHARKSAQGRITAYTRRLEEQRAEAAAPKPSTEPEPDPLAPIKSDYPEFGEPLDKKFKPLEEKLSKFEAKEKAAQAAFDTQMATDLAENEKAFEIAHPGVWDMLKANGKEFGKWVVDQPLAIRQAVHVNREAIVDLDGALNTFDGFKKHLDALTPPPVVPTPTPAPTPAPTSEPSLKRAAQLAGSEAPRTPNSRPAVSSIPESGDPEAMWKAMAATDPEEAKYRQRA